MKVAIVHYWLVGMRGGEKVVEAICELFPEADIFCHVYDSSLASDIIKKHRIQTTFIQKLPFAKRLYQAYLPLMPLALEQLDLRDYDLVISSESGPAKGVITGPNATHICYCHTPMRYVWDMYHDYRESTGRVKRFLMAPIIHYLRIWDRLSADRVDKFIANSEFVSRRIFKYYRREAQVINPPVNLSGFAISHDAGEFYLFVGQLTSYKKADLAVKAFNLLDRELVIIGEGEQRRFLERIAGNNIKILGRQSTEVVRDHFHRCKAVIFPGVEDFGIVPLEAMAAGRPVLAFRSGGACETVIEGVTGEFFDEQTPEAIANAVSSFESNVHKYDPREIRNRVEKFDTENFKGQLNAAIYELLGAGAD